ncbi:MAG: class I SAM-dependent methyltransferase [Anaerobiospirillum sp.]|nr:class I SAM-dependent methyltransferase [Anaerobiospirillum sp.]
MSSLISQLSSALAAALPHNLMETAPSAIVIYPNSINFGLTSHGSILISGADNHSITVAYRNTDPNNLRSLVWGKDRFACIPGIALNLKDTEFSATVKLEFAAQATNNARVRKNLEQTIVRFVGQFVVKCEKILDSICDAYQAQLRYEQLYLELRTANFFLQNLDQDNLGKQFDAIYSTNRWGNGSGAGSLPQVTAGYRDFLQQFIAQHQIKTIADVGCGDWQFSRLMDFSKVQYTGYDVSSIVIEHNTRLYQKDNVKFVHYEGDFGQVAPADLLICKDVLQHLPNSYIHNFLKILPKFKYALITNDIDDLQPENNNADLPVAGGFRAVDLRAAPFNLPAQVSYDFEWSKGTAFHKLTLLHTNLRA